MIFIWKEDNFLNDKNFLNRVYSILCPNTYILQRVAIFKITSSNWKMSFVMDCFSERIFWSPLPHIHQYKFFNDSNVKGTQIFIYRFPNCSCKKFPVCYSKLWISLLCREFILRISEYFSGPCNIKMYVVPTQNISRYSLYNKVYTKVNKKITTNSFE